MAAGSAETPGPKAAPDRPSVGSAGPLPCLELPTYAAACALVSGRYSCLVAGPHRRHIALSPRYLHRKRSGIREQLDAELLRYSESLLGVPVAYDNIKVVGELGDIYDDQGHIHLNIEADFVIFCPEPGQKLMGTVNKVSFSHIGCLVHGCFNASIPKPEHMPTEQWQSLEINVGDELEFEVFRLDSDAAGVFCIRGKLNTSSLQSKCSEVSKEVTEIAAEEIVEKPPRKKKKKKRDLEPCGGEGGTPGSAELGDSTMLEGPDVQTDGHVNGLSEDEPRKKKKKKKKKVLDPCRGEGGTPGSAELGDSTMLEDPDVQNDFNVNGLSEDEPKKKKKKKKKKDLEPCGGEGGAAGSAELGDSTMLEGPDVQTDGHVNGLSEDEPRKKKKKKKVLDPCGGEGGAPGSAELGDSTMLEGPDVQTDFNVNGLSEDEPKKKKKKKKKKDLEPCGGEGGTPGSAELGGSTMLEGPDVQTDGHVNGLSEDEPRKQKRKRKKEQDQDPVVQGSDSSGYQSDHKMKKKKRKQSEADFTPVSELFPERKKQK